MSSSESRGKLIAVIHHCQIFKKTFIKDINVNFFHTESQCRPFGLRDKSVKCAEKLANSDVWATQGAEKNPKAA